MNPSSTDGLQIRLPIGLAKAQRYRVAVLPVGRHDQLDQVGELRQRLSFLVLLGIAVKGAPHARNGLAQRTLADIGAKVRARHHGSRRSP
jgi:hypothetical protein